MANNESPKSVLKESWPILAVGLTIAGLLAWMGWEVTRPDVVRRDR